MNQRLRDAFTLYEPNAGFDDLLGAAQRFTSFMPATTAPMERINNARYLASRHLVQEVGDLRAACAAVIEAEDGTEESEMDEAVSLCRAALRG